MLQTVKVDAPPLQKEVFPTTYTISALNFHPKTGSTQQSVHILYYALH